MDKAVRVPRLPQGATMTKRCRACGIERTGNLGDYHFAGDKEHRWWVCSEACLWRVQMEYVRTIVEDWEVVWP